MVTQLYLFSLNPDSDAMLSTQNRDELTTKGYTVVERVLTPDESTTYRGQYEQWLATFDKGAFPHTNKSLIQRYKVGHMEPSWAIRLKTKSVFREIWSTEELLTSFDAIAIGRPPEDGEEDFYRPGELQCQLGFNVHKLL